MVRFLSPRVLRISFLFAATFAMPAYAGMSSVSEPLPTALNLSYSDSASSILETLEERRSQGTNREVQEDAVLKRGTARRAPEPISNQFARWRGAFVERTEQLQEKMVVRRVERFSMKLTQAIEKLDRQYARILLYLNKRAAAGKDVSKARLRLIEANAVIADARRAVAAFPDSLRSVSRMRQREAELTIHARVRETKAALRVAHTALLAVLQSLEKE